MINLVIGFILLHCLCVMFSKSGLAELENLDPISRAVRYITTMNNIISLTSDNLLSKNTFT